MAKFEKNKNESPEIDLKNLTVRLAGMGMEKEAEEMADTRKKNYSTVEDEETEADEESSAQDADITDNEEEILEDVEESSGEEVSDEVEEFFEKRAKERNLTLEKVEELANEMEETSDDESKKVVKLSKIKSEKTVPVEKKKAHFDAVTIVGILVALAVLAGGIYYLMNSLRKSPNLGMTQQEFTNAYHDSVQFKQILSNYGSTMVEPKYRTEVEDDVKARTFDLTIENSLGLPVYVTGVENKDTKKLVRLRFSISFNNQEALNSAEIIMVSFMQALYPDRDTSVCFGSITGALDLTNASTKDAVAVKDGKYAYALTLRTLDGRSTLIMDIIPESSADNYNFTDTL